jgi:hypothetical protein
VTSADVGWVVQLSAEHELVELFVNEGVEMGWSLDHKLSAKTCEQLSDMFARIAAAARRRAHEESLKREAEARRIAEIAARQGELPLSGVHE